MFLVCASVRVLISLFLRPAAPSVTSLYLNCPSDACLQTWHIVEPCELGPHLVKAELTLQPQTVQTAPTRAWAPSPIPPPSPAPPGRPCVSPLLSAQLTSEGKGFGLSELLG